MSWGTDEEYLLAMAEEKAIRELHRLCREVQREHAKKHSVSRGAITPRQTEILRMLCDGKSPKQIARELGISHRTVENHRWRINQKTGCSGVKLGVWAAKNGVV